MEEGLTNSERTGQHSQDADLHRVRGDILLQAEPPDPSAAEGAYRKALDVARVQGARTFELQAAVPLARLLQSTNRRLEAHDVLIAALDRFAPTPALPAIAEAEALRAALKKT